MRYAQGRLVIAMKSMKFCRSLIFLFGIASCGTTPTLSLPESQTLLVHDTLQAQIANTIVAPTVNSATTQDEQVENPFAVVKLQFEQSLLWRTDCSQKPKSCQVDQYTIVGTPFHAALTKQLSGYAKNNIYSLPNQGTRKIRIDSITTDQQTMTAVVETCIYDTVILFMDGFIYNDHIASSFANWTLQWDNARWKWIDHKIHRLVYNTDICNFEP